jgi:hypothetical protein
VKQSGALMKQHGNSGRKQSAEHIAKRTAASIGKPLSDEHKKKLAMIERIPEWRAKIKAARARQVMRKGWKMSDEQRNKISETKRASHLSSWNKGIKWPAHIPRRSSPKGISNVALIGKPRPDMRGNYQTTVGSR